MFLPVIPSHHTASFGDWDDLRAVKCCKKWVITGVAYLSNPHLLI